MKRIGFILLKILKITGITAAALVALLFLAPIIFPDTVGRQIKSWANQSITGDLNFSRSRLSFFTHFPSLTLTLYDVDLKGSAPFDKDTLLSARKLGFGINLQKLIFDHVVHINKIYLTDAQCNMLVSADGKTNYGIYKSTPSSKNDSANENSAASLHLEKIKIVNCHLIYDDRSAPMLIDARHINYQGTGDLSQSVFDLASHIESDSLSFALDSVSYLSHKSIDADLITRINTQTLALIFRKNDLKVNQLGLQFSGKLDILHNGYNMDFKLESVNAGLYQLITAFPPQYIDWLSKTTIRGMADLKLNLKGRYIASANEMPDLSLTLRLRDGYIAYQGVKLPLSEIGGLAVMQLPKLDEQQLYLRLDSFSFRMDQDYFRAGWESHGLDEPSVRATAKGRIDLDNLKKALGISGFDMQGRLSLDADADGRFSRKIIKTSLRKTDTVIASIPSFHINCQVDNGTVRYPHVPEAIKQIFLKMEAFCPDANYRHAVFRIDTLHAAMLSNFLQGRFQIHSAPDFPLEGDLEGLVNLGEIKQCYSLDSLQLAGLLRFNIHTRGKYAPDHHLFPKTRSDFSLQNASVHTKYYPHPIEQINIEADAFDGGGTLRDMHLNISRAALLFEGKHFYAKASLKNFDDLQYDIAVRGYLDIGRLYQVFSRKELAVSGIVRADLSFQGKQSDVDAGRFDLLRNKGTLELKKFRIVHEYFPQPLYISQGSFHFDSDKMWFDRFMAKYGSTDFQLDGYMENAINYALGGSKTLAGNFNLSSPFINIGELSVYAGPGASDAKKSETEQDSPTGVVMVPQHIDLTLKAEIGKISYSGLTIEQFNGGVHISDGSVELVQTGFNLVGTQIGMSGKYTALSPRGASFDYHLQAKDFDIHRAYAEVKLFRDLASSAKYAQGIISLDYSLSGRLNENMRPVYPSLAGGGTLSVKQVKFRNWKLFNTVSSKTEKTELKDPDISKIEIKSTIKNNLITIPRFKFKTGGFRVRIEGQTSFDNQLNLKMRIGLPPLGIIGIPLRVTGRADDPKIKVGKKDTDPLAEKEDD
ncbi:MAG TPA: AsmA-like C-terminal region-containing protein [Puia sp.]|nr:AsmA-like C-terminal region-containing protein [Puia sp.]